MIRFVHKGDFKKTERYLRQLDHKDIYKNIELFAKRGVEALEAATPKDSGVTAGSWGYEIERANGKVQISWVNSNVNQGLNIVLLIQYGHGTGWGGYVQGRDFVNPAIAPIFDQIADDVWREVTASG